LLVELREQVAATVRWEDRCTGRIGQETAKPFGEAAAVRVTFPLKLAILVTVTVMVTPVCPRFKFAVEAAMVKSPTWTVAEADLETVPGEP